MPITCLSCQRQLHTRLAREGTRRQSLESCRMRHRMYHSNLSNSPVIISEDIFGDSAQSAAAPGCKGPICLFAYNIRWSSEQTRRRNQLQCHCLLQREMRSAWGRGLRGQRGAWTVKELEDPSQKKKKAGRREGGREGAQQSSARVPNHGCWCKWAGFYFHLFIQIWAWSGIQPLSLTSVTNSAYFRNVDDPEEFS